MCGRVRFGAVSAPEIKAGCRAVFCGLPEICGMGLYCAVGGLISVGVGLLCTSGGSLL